MAPLNKSMGLPSIESVGLQYKDGKMGILLDATFCLGPIGLALRGFGINYRFDKAKMDPSTVQQQGLGDIDVSLSGLLVSFDNPPLTVAGAFKHSKEGNSNTYTGGLIVSFKPWMIQATECIPSTTLQVNRETIPNRTRRLLPWSFSSV
jgi:hypothetical protein